MKKGSHQSTRKKQFSLSAILWTAVVLLFFLFIFQEYLMPKSAPIIVKSDASTLATVMPSFAQANQLEELTKSKPTECQGRTSCFNYQYQGETSLASLELALLAYLEEQGYKVEKYHYTTDISCKGYKLNQQGEECDIRLIKEPINEGNTIFRFFGRSKDNVTNHVYGTISDHTYMDKTSEYEHAIPEGNAVLDITFTTKD